MPARLGWQGGSKTGYGNSDGIRIRDAGVSRARSPGCYCIAFSTAYVRRRRVVEIRFGSVCCACVILYRENTMNFWKTLSPGRTDYESAAVGAVQRAGGDQGLQTRAQPVQSGGSHLPTAYGPNSTLSKWLRWLWLCRGPRKDRRMMSLAGRCAGQQIPSTRLALVSGLMSWAGKAGALETTGCARVDISLNQTAVCAGACTASTRRSSGASKSARLRRE